jgi:serine/threonine-protein kinase
MAAQAAAGGLAMVNRLFQCDPDRLKSYLDDELGAGDQAELADHLDHCGTCREALERLAAGSRLWEELRHLGDPDDSPGLASPPDEPRVGLPGSLGPAKAPEGPDLEFLAPSEDRAHLGRLGPYEVIGVLGEGGMGVVLKAFDPSLSRVVAIKVLAPQMAASGSARRRFSREAKAAAAVVHEHVVAIHAVDQDPRSGLPYLVMPYIAGRSLQERIDRDGPLRPEEVLRIGRQAALGLAAAHEQGLVHRDIKPSNILLENGLERVKITDFGLARAVDDASHSQSGYVAGTPQYMSPEQACGEAVDHRSDLFSLGSVLYAMCAGHSPFRAKTTMGVLRRVCDETPRPLDEINPEVPEALEAIIERLHAKDPSGRYQTATEVAEELGRSLADRQRPGARSSRRATRTEPHPGRPASPPEGQKADAPAAAAASRPRPRTVAIAATALLVLLGLAAAGTSARLAFLDPPLRPAGSDGERAGPPGVGGGVGQGVLPVNVIVTSQADGRMIVGSGNLATKRWDLADFTAVEIAHPFRAEITRADRSEVNVTADDNVLEHVQVTQEGPRLRVRLEDNHSYRLRRAALRVAIALPVLESVDLSHGAHATIRGFESQRPFEARARHGSLLEGTIGAGRLMVHAAHGSTVALGGSAATARLAAAHGSTLRLEGLAIQDTQLSLQHGSTATVNAKSEKGLKAEAHHGSTLNGVVDGGDVDLEAAHGSRITLRGSAHRARIAGNHASRLALAELALDAAVVRLDQASSATINAKSRVEYQVGQASRLRFLDNPAVTGSVSPHGGSARAVRPGDDQPAGEKKKPAAAAPGAEPSPRRPSGSASARSRVDHDEVITIDLTHHHLGARIEGTGRRATRTVEVKDFTTIRIERLLAADVTRSDSYQVSLTADDNVLGFIEAVREGSTLTLRMAPGDYRLRERPRASITLPVLEGIVVAGAAQATIQGFESDRSFRARVSGASRLVGSIRAGDINFDVSGASTLTLRGSVREARLSASGASTLDLTDGPLNGEKVLIDVSGASTARLRGLARAAVLRASGASRLALADLALEAADVQLDGASHATVRIQGLLNYNLSSASRLEYLGDPTIGSAKRTGASSVSRRRPEASRVPDGGRVPPSQPSSAALRPAGSPA